MDLDVGTCFRAGKMVMILTFLPLFLQSCFTGSRKGELICAEANPEKGFNYSYFLFIPDGTSAAEEKILIVEPNNSGFADDDYDKHREKAGRTASLDFYTGNFVARKLNYPLLVPVFPRPLSDWKIYTHALDRDAVIQKNSRLERIDLQLIAMIEDARKRLLELGYSIHEQVLMTGFSASGSFVNRFTAIHPGKVMAVAAGGVNGLLILPVDTLQGIPLGFPLGTADFDVLFGYTFDSCQFARTPQFYYMGDHDTNDAVPYDDGYDLSERQVVFELLGEEMQPARWNNCIAIYREKNIKAQLKTYQGSGHEITNEIREDVLNFFREQLQPCLLKVVEKQLPVE